MDYYITSGEKFHPRKDLLGKSNYRIFMLIDEDGKIEERVLLNATNDNQREEIIFAHFLQNYFNCFGNDSEITEFISRDLPWDFHIKIDNKNDLIVEITAMADNPQLFEKFKNEERLLSISKKESITIRELIRLESAFPDTEIKSFIGSYLTEGQKKDDIVLNPFFGKSSFIFLSSQNPYVPDFHENLQVTIDKKLRKNHSDKNKVTLIIDNRTILFDLDTVNKKISEIESYICKLPFKEVWLYTGYYSNNDGSNSEYTLIPLKISRQKRKILKNLL